MRFSYYKILVCLAVAALGAATGTVSQAKDAEGHELREPREDRGGRELRDPEHEDRSGSNSGHDGNDRSGSNSGRDDARRDNSSRDNGRRARIDVERDTQGGDRQRDEVLLIGPEESLAAVRSAGFALLSEERLENLRQTMARVRVRDGETVEQLMESLRKIAPGARVAPNHIFRPGQAGSLAATLDRKPASDVARHEIAVQASPPDIGVIDTGADARQRVLEHAIVATRGFASGGYVARPHGTAVAQLAASQGATLASADVFGLDRNNELAASAERIAQAIDWMLGQQVRVLNISIEGPRNLVLEFVVQTALQRGVAIVAAAGNDGPAAAPAYPAAIAGVIAVTALDEHGQIYRRASRGPHVQFAARGSYGRNQSLVETPVALAGTSFAAPVVAAEIARRWHNDATASREQILAGLESSALDMGAPGRDPVYGWGEIRAGPMAELQQVNLK